MDDFIRQTLTIAVAQICNDIGWHSISDSSMKIMTDILKHYISDLSVTSKKYAEHAYSDVPDIEDLEKAFHQKSVSLIELRSYLKTTGSVKFPHSLPVLNIPVSNSLNIMKPGSREMVTRPIHIHEHLPTLYTEPIEEEQNTEQIDDNIEDKEEPDQVILHKQLREISSVVMTSGGFLSPSREGRLAESKLLPFPEIKNNKPPESSKLSNILSITKEYPSNNILLNKSQIKSKKIKSGLKKKQKGTKIQPLFVHTKEKKTEILKKIKKSKVEKVVVAEEPVLKPVLDETNVVSVTEDLHVPKIVIPTSHTDKVKIEDILPKFSFFGPLPDSPELISPTFSQKISTTVIDKTEKPISPVLNVENNDINHKEQKKKKKDKKKEKKEKKKLKEKEKKKEKIKGTNKVPKLKFRFGTKMDSVTKVLPIEKPPEETIALISEPEPIEVDVDIESKSDISIDVVHDTKSPPKVLIQKIKTKIVTKTVQPIIPAAIETPPPAFYFDDAGNQVWICPMCTKPDDGSPMIGCDGCDVWYHWVCVGIQCPPDCAIWYCPRCLAKRAQQPKGKRGRPRKNK